MQVKYHRQTLCMLKVGKEICYNNSKTPGDASDIADLFRLLKHSHDVEQLKETDDNDKDFGLQDNVDDNEIENENAPMNQNEDDDDDDDERQYNDYEPDKLKESDNSDEGQFNNNAPVNFNEPDDHERALEEPDYSEEYGRFG
ncbi:hypothetical protein evm_001478 [Chilo suppressalis]|nr:hypothetical protein evm_001478 [Chilo suppressalis]